MRVYFSALMLGVLGACAPGVPDSGAGIGFENPDDAQRAREAALSTGQPLVPPSVLSDETLAPATSGEASARPIQQVATDSDATPADIAAQTAAALAAASTNSGQAPHRANPSNTTPNNNVAISDENDFSAVSERQTIESDAERIARNRAQYRVITPTALPTRAGGSQPNIVEYALRTTNPRGAQIYPRSGFNNAAKAARNCARFTSPDQAQAAFLSQGGPERDGRGLDPDGDGYACFWDPAPFRQAVTN